MTPPNINERVAILETVFPEFKETIKAVGKKQIVIESDLTELKISTAEIIVQLKNQYNWVDKWKLVMSGVGITGGVLSVIVGLVVYFK